MPLFFRSCRVRCVAAIVLVIPSLAGCSSRAAPESAGATPPGQTRMLQRLEEVRQRALVDDPFFKTAGVAEAELALDRLPPGSSPADQFKKHLELATDFRRLGEVAKAVEHMQAANALREQSPGALDPEFETRFLFEVGLTYLRLGETQNCVYCQGSDSCIVPIRQRGVHQSPEGSRQAAEFFLQVLQRQPDHLESRWLLNIAAMTLGEYPALVPEPFRLPADAFEPKSDFPRFTDVALPTGLRVIDCSGGAVADDFDEDGLFDVLTSTWDPSGQLHYFQNSGDGTFADLTEQAGLIGELGGINLVQGDYDNDGHVDVLVLRGAWLNDLGKQPSSLLKNLGQDRFRDVTYDVGLGDVEAPTPTAAWLDFDNDGDLDVYFGHEGTACRLYRNDGATGFVDVTQAAGVANGRYTKAVSAGDYNADGLPDLYVSNLDGDNRLYRNRGDGRFVDVAEQLGVTLPAQGFPAWFWDVNNDGRLDIFAASYNPGLDRAARYYFGLPRTDEPDRLYIQQADGGFREASEAYGLTHETQPMGANFGDLDNDGFPDFYLGTGYPGLEGLMPNLMFHNLRGTAFEDVTMAGGFGHLQKGHGVAFADLDNDGDQDVFAQTGGAFPADAFGNVLFENPGFGNHWIRIHLVGVRSNRSAIGARIRAEVQEGGARRSIYKWVNSGGAFGASPLTPQLGLGAAEAIETLEITWPASGIVQTFQHVPADICIEIREDQQEYRPVALRKFELRKFPTAE